MLTKIFVFYFLFKLYIVKAHFLFLQKHEKPKYILCLAFADNGDVLSGDSNGNIFVWCKGL